jgi:hypothetical protein
MGIGGRLERRLDLASGRFALIANGREFTLVPGGARWSGSSAMSLRRGLDRPGSTGPLAVTRRAGIG